MLEAALIRGSFKLQELMTRNVVESPLFPKLKELEVLQARDYAGYSAGHVAAILSFHAPVLEKFNSGTQQHGIDREVMAGRVVE